MKYLLALIAVVLFAGDLVLAVLFWACDDKVREERQWDEK